MGTQYGVPGVTALNLITGAPTHCTPSLVLHLRLSPTPSGFSFISSLVVAVKTVLTAVCSPETFLVSHGCHSTRVPKSLLGHENLPENRSDSESHLYLQITHLRNQVESQKDIFLFFKTMKRALSCYWKACQNQTLFPSYPSASWSSVAFAVPVLSSA